MVALLSVTMLFDLSESQWLRFILAQVAVT